jgi:hypothetical protein
MQVATRARQDKTVAGRKIVERITGPFFDTVDPIAAVRLLLYL